MKKTTKIFGVIFATLTALSLFLPIYKATFTDGESMTLLLRGYELYEFSAWGVVTMLAPLILIATMFTKFSKKTKCAMVVCAFVLGNISVHIANTSMRDWLYSNATGMVFPYDGLIFYSVFLLCALVFCFVDCIKKKPDLICPTIDDFREYIESENITIGSENIFDKEFLLCNKPCKVSSLDAGTSTKETQAYILFATPDGYFITDTQDDCQNKEIEIDGETAGFAHKSTPMGLVNVFYEDFDLTTLEKIKLMPKCEISNGDAELYNDGKRVEINLATDLQSIKANLFEDNHDVHNFVGSVVIQSGKLAAVVTSVDEECDMLVCESAEKYAKELHKAAYEQEMFGIAGGFEEFLKRRKNKKRD